MILGVTGDNYESISGASIQIKEPQLIHKLSNMKISTVIEIFCTIDKLTNLILQIYAGSTFSLFLTEKKDVKKNKK